MAGSAPSLVYSTEFDARTGKPVPAGPGIVRVTAPNTGPYTFTGTNTYLVGDSSLAILDPGPDDGSHFDALLSAINGRPVEAIVLTHTHGDHCDLVPRLQERTGAPLWSGGPHRLSRPARLFETNPFHRPLGYRLVPQRELHDGDTLYLDGLTLTAIATPGHCANHLAFAVDGADMLFSGDHIMGWSSSVIAAPDGDLAAYLASLDKVIALGRLRYLPGHGGEIVDGRDHARALRAHRLMRNGQILGLLAQGPQQLPTLTSAIYPQLSGRLALGAQRTLLAHLEYLEADGRVRLKRGLAGTVASLV